MKLEFIELNADNWKTCAKLTTEEDHKLVSPNTYSIAEAQFYPKAISRAIAVDGEMIGYTMFGEHDDHSDLWAIDRFMIAEAHRRNGYGYQTMNAILDLGRAEGFQKFITSTLPTNERMQNLLTKVGFFTKHELDDGEWVYYLND